MRVSAVNLYPVKSTGPVPVDAVDVELSGLRDDRRWAVVDLHGKRLKAERHDRLLRVTATPREGGLTLSAAELGPLTLQEPRGRPAIPVDISRFGEAIDAGDAAADWFSRHLDEPVRLVWQDDTAKRPMSTSHGGTGTEALSLADTGPLLLTSTTSLAQLNDWIGDEEVVMQRFRPNVVVDGIEEAFSEDSWRRFSMGGLPFRFAEHCDRCVITTIDPCTLKHGKEPIRTLAQRRKWDGKAWFGIRIVPLMTGRLAIGDEVAVTRTA